jgi:hypothetical protein
MPDDIRANWGPLRRILVFVLGIATILDGLVGSGEHIAQLIIGAFLIGIIPVDQLLESLGRRYVRPVPGPPTTRVEIINGDNKERSASGP